MVDSFPSSNNDGKTKSGQVSLLTSVNEKMNVDKPVEIPSNELSSVIKSPKSSVRPSSDNHESVTTPEAPTNDINMIIMGGPCKSDTAETIIITKENSNDSISASIPKDDELKCNQETPVEEHQHSSPTSASSVIVKNHSGVNNVNNISSEDSVKYNKLKVNNQQKTSVVYNSSVNNNSNSDNSTNSDSQKSIQAHCATNLHSGESQNGNMDENNHKQHSVIASTSSVEQIESRKVEPLKINLHREPIKTVIKLPHQEPPHPPKIIIKPLKPQESDNAYSVKSNAFADDMPQSEMQIIPKLHIGSNAEHTEPHIVPKLTIRGVQGASSQVNHHSVIESNNDQVIPKLTIKKDNHHHHYHHHHYNNASSDKPETPLSPLKLHIKAIPKPEVMASPVLTSSEGVKLTIKPIPEPPLPKLTIKTNSLEPEASSVVSSTSTNEPVLPKLTIKPLPKPPTSSNEQHPIPKLTIKPIVKPHDESSSENSVTSADMSPTSTVSPVHHVPKLTVKLPKENDTVLQPPIKLNIKPIIPPAPASESTSSTSVTSSSCSSSSSANTSPSTSPQKKSSTNNEEEDELIVIPKVTIKTIDDEVSTPKVTLKPIPKPVELSPTMTQPLEIVTSSKVIESGQDSPRIILKINKGSSTTTTETTPKKIHSPVVIEDSNDEPMPKQKNDLKRVHVEPVEETPAVEAKKAKIVNNQEPQIQIQDDDDVIVVNNDPVEEKPVEEAAPKQPSKVVETHTNFKEILRMTRQKRQQLVAQESIPETNKNGKHDKLTSKLMAENDTGSSSDCMIIEEPVVVVEKLDKFSIANHKKRLSEDHAPVETTPVVKKRGRPKKITTPIVVAEEQPRTEDEDSQSCQTDPLALPPTIEEVDDDSNQNHTGGEEAEDSGETVDSKGTPRARGGRGRGGRGKKFVEVVKDGKTLQVKLDDAYEEDNSPTFSIWNNYHRGRGRGRGRGSRGGRGKFGRVTPMTPNSSQIRSPDKGQFATPSSEPRRRLLVRELNTPSDPVQVDEDTRMSADFNFQTPTRSISEFMNNDESQSSFMSSASVTMDASMSNTATTVTTSTRKPKAKMEVFDVNGLSNFKIEQLAEYEWPQGANERHGETYMIQEQICEYLGVKSFKRKYPDLMRRPVEMEERNFILEKGLVTEKMCDLGLTAVYASEILDIMCNDYPEKYEEYKRYQREKHFREVSIKQKMMRSEASNVDRSQMQKERAIESASSWNTSFNKERLDTRRTCIDLQTYVVQVPLKNCDNLGRPTIQKSTATNYPIALVPGQFSEYYRNYTPEELACYPINSMLIDPKKLQDIIVNSDKYRHLLDEDSSSSDSGSSSEDDSSSDSDESDDSEASDSSKNANNNKKPVVNSNNNNSDKQKSNSLLCQVCLNPQNLNQYKRPERFVRCTTCKRKAHPSCIGMSHKMFIRSLEYNWQCAECKSCDKCKRPKDDKMLFCDQCDRGYHIYCLGLRNVPEGRWNCNLCSICTNCGTRNPEGHPNPSLTQQQRQNLAMIAHWFHEYRENELTKIREHARTLCVPCARQRKNEMKN